MGVKKLSQNFRVANIIEEGKLGGPQVRITMVASALKNMGVETVVFFPKQESDRFREKLELSGVPHRTLRMHRLGRGGWTMCVFVLSFVWEVLDLHRELKFGKFDLVHISGGAWQMKGAVAGRLAGIPVLWHLNDTQMPATIVLMFRWLAKRLAAGFIVTASRVQHYYLEGTPLANKPTYMVQAPVDTTLYDPKRIAADESLYAYSRIRIVSVANINPIKGFETLIDAAALLKDMIGDYSVIIVGPVFKRQKKYFEELQSRIQSLRLEEHFFFLGQHDNIASVMRTADIFVCSSVAESGPMTVWEAMSMECAVISTDVGDVAQYIKNGENGYIVPVGDAVSMAHFIARLAVNSGLRKKFGRKAREIAISELDIKQCARRHRDAYMHILGFN